MKIEKPIIINAKIFSSEEILRNRKKYSDLCIEFDSKAVHFLFGRISKKTRGITYGFYEGLLEVEIILDSQPTEGEIRAMSGIETDIACLFPPSRGFRINFVVSIVSQETSILDKKKNMGWVFIFRDELSQ